MATLPLGARPANPARRLLSAIEPWYDWGATYAERIDATGEGPGYFVSLQWLGLSFTLFLGRTPAKREAR